MVYVETVSVKGQRYYRLAHSYRLNGKVLHKTKYIGKVLLARDKLEELKKEFLREIQEGKFRYLSPSDVQKIETKRKKYIQELDQYSTLALEKHLEEFIIRFTYDSSKLSGVDVTLRQTFLILKEGRIPKGIHNLRTVRAIENHEKGVLMVTKYRGGFNLRFLRKLHSLLLSGIDDAIAGKLRSELQVNVKIAGTSYVPPKWNNVEKEVNGLFSWYTSKQRKLHPLELAALLHLKMISLQPFCDGNSRLSRLLMNWILWKKGYPPIDIPIEDLDLYYDALDKYQLEKKEKPFVDYVKKRYFKGG